MQKCFLFPVDKALLEIPEDELDRLRIPIKDIILLEEHRERLAVCILYSNPFVAMPNNCYSHSMALWLKVSPTVPFVFLCRKKRR